MRHEGTDNYVLSSSILECMNYISCILLKDTKVKVIHVSPTVSDMINHKLHIVPKIYVKVLYLLIKLSGGIPLTRNIS